MQHNFFRSGHINIESGTYLSSISPTETKEENLKEKCVNSQSGCRK